MPHLLKRRRSRKSQEKSYRKGKAFSHIRRHSREETTLLIYQNTIEFIYFHSFSNN
ncbi:MAG: hypothetical protein LH614_14175 [Pyrinomonadaceae bacterium]|nr:hypothetical protein [Pyrinomonadaceae bacterium]